MGDDWFDECAAINDKRTKSTIAINTPVAKKAFVEG
jgi:hypothetical protein